VSPGDVLVKYTYLGDANYDGQITGGDYSAIDNGFAFVLTGWVNGDYNLDGTVTGSDYSLIDNAFAFQSIVLSDAAGNGGGASPVPEPCTIALLLIGILCASRHVRKLTSA
jgi:hypothetical protein